MQTTKMKYTNKTTKRCIVTLEPWADMYVVNPDQSVDLVIEQHGEMDEHLIELQILDNHDIYIYAGQHQELMLMYNGEELPTIDQRRIEDHR